MPDAIFAQSIICLSMMHTIVIEWPVLEFLSHEAELILRHSGVISALLASWPSYLVLTLRYQFLKLVDISQHISYY